MKNLALLLLCVSAVQINARGVYPNGCPKDWTIRKLIPHPNCNKFYLCWNGRLLVHSCPPRFYFNVERERCEWQSVRDCRDLNIPDDISKSDEVDDHDQNDGSGNYDPSKAPAICAKLGSDGVLVAHENCNKYYICNHGKPLAQRCPANLFFNPKNDECDWPSNVHCRGRVILATREDTKQDWDLSSLSFSDSDEEGRDGNVRTGNFDPSKAPAICAAKNSSGVLVAHEKCNKYYICDNGKPVVQRCPANLFFNPKKDECDWPRNVRCRGRVILAPREDTKQDWDLSSLSFADSDEKGRDGNVKTGNFDTSKAPAICAAKNSSGVLVAHEKCNKYYICDNGKPVVQRCPANLFFNPKKDECDWPSNVRCRGRVILAPREDAKQDWDLSSLSFADSDEKGRDGNVRTGNFDPSKAPAICAAKNSSGVLVAHEKCNKYYICDNGKPVVQRCPANLFFNPKKDECDWPSNVHCRGRVILAPREDTKQDWDLSSLSFPGSDEKGRDGNVRTGNFDPSKAPAICAAKNSSGVLVAHEKCNKYYICDHGKPVVQRCPTNLFFNPKKDECDWPKNVHCRDKTISEEETKEDQDDKASDENGNDGHVGAGHSDPSKAPYICAIVGSDGVLVAHKNCNKYYICVNGKPVTQRCPDNLFFNPKKDECDWPKNVHCWDTVNSEENTKEDQDDKGSDENGNEGNVGAGNSDPSKAPLICAAKNSSGVLVAHEKCNKYYICDHGKPVVQRCPANLFFNPRKDECDWPKNVDCRDTVTSGSSEYSSEEDSWEEDNTENNTGKDTLLKRILHTLRQIIRRLLRNQ